MSAFFAARTGLREANPDVIMNVSHPFPLGVAVIACGRLRGVPVLLRMTGDPFTERKLYNSLYLRIRKKLVHELLFGRLIYSKATMIVPVGTILSNVIEKIGISSKKIYVRPQPFDVHSFSYVDHAEKMSARKRLKLDPYKKTVLFIGSLTWGKGVDRLVNIIKLVEKNSDVYQFCVLGEGPKLHCLQAMNDSCIVLPGNVSHDKVIDYFRAADVLIHPTRRDALPNVILEAIASGIPVIASPVGEIPNYVTNIACSDNEFAELIVSDRLVIDVLPNDMKWEEQKNSYLKLFDKVMNTDRSKIN